MQYELEVEKGEDKQEEGHFYRAAPFRVTSQGRTLECTYKHDAHREVIYELKEVATFLGQFEHPFFVPDCPPDQVNETLKITDDVHFFFAALVRLGITKQKDYHQYYGESEHNVSYKVEQPNFL